MAKISRGKLDDTLAAMFSNIDYRSSYLFYAHMVGQCSIKIEPIPAPAGVAFNVDHYDLYINPEQFDEHDLKGRLAILKHEMFHILYDHVGRMEDRSSMVWNYATDCAINQQIDQDHLPDIGITPETLGKELNIHIPINESSEFYYNLIKNSLKEKQEQKKSESGSGEDGNDGEAGNMPQLLDNHDLWQESKGDKDLQKDMTKRMIERAQSEAIKGAGTIPDNISEWLDLHSSKAEVQWKKVLRGIIGNKQVGTRSTIMKQDRRFPKREDLRGKTRERKFNLLVIADVSGSMSSEAIMSTIGEVRHICDITKTDVNLIQIDTVAYEPETLSKKTKLIERKGAGGTELSPALDMAKKHNLDYQAIVVLTDGGLWGNEITNFKNTNKKVIWLIEPNGRIIPEMNSEKMIAIQLKNM